jgi:hypothetical protein
MGKAYILAVALALAACADEGPSPEAVANFEKDKAACGALHTAVARARCFDGVVDRYVRPTVRDQDLLTLEEAERVALAEKVDAGKMTQAEADLQLAQARTGIFSEVQRRSNNANIAAAATMATMPLPTTCHSYDNGAGLTTSCY